MKINNDILVDFKSNEPVTEEEIEARDLMEARAEEIGISLTTYDGEEEDSAYDNPYALEALRYIITNKEIPEELKIKIKEFENDNNG